MNAVPTLNLLVLRARDPARLCRFYSALGLHFVTEKHGAGPVHHASELGGAVLEIYPRDVDEPSTAGTRLGLTVQSLDEALGALRSVPGATVSRLSQVTSARRSAVVCDPEGHKVELVERAQRAAEGS